jgi:PhnB protein
MQLSPYLSFDGNCEEAFKVYEQVLRGKIESLVRYAGTPGESFVPPEWKDKIMHARVVFGTNVLMGSDTGSQHFKAPQGYSVSLTLNDVQESERIFNALAEGGTVQMKFEKTFWAEGFGMVKDRFGVPWMVNCETSS